MLAQSLAGGENWIVLIKPYRRPPGVIAPDTFLFNLTYYYLKDKTVSTEYPHLVSWFHFSIIVFNMYMVCINMQDTRPNNKQSLSSLHNAKATRTTHAIAKNAHIHHLK